MNFAKATEYHLTTEIYAGNTPAIDPNYITQNTLCGTGKPMGFHDCGRSIAARYIIIRIMKFGYFDVPEVMAWNVAKILVSPATIQYTNTETARMLNLEVNGITSYS